jgi:hypothetical protein
MTVSAEFVTVRGLQIQVLTRPGAGLPRSGRMERMMAEVDLDPAEARQIIAELQQGLIEHAVSEAIESHIGSWHNAGYDE